MKRGGSGWGRKATLVASFAPSPNREFTGSRNDRKWRAAEENGPFAGLP